MPTRSRGTATESRSHRSPHDEPAEAGDMPHDDTPPDTPETPASGTQAHSEGVAPDPLYDRVGTVATALAVGVGAALIEAELIPGMVIGAGAILLGRMFPQIGGAARPMVKGVVRAGMAMGERARAVVAEATEQVQDVIAEVQAERVNGGVGPAEKAGELAHAGATSHTH